MEIVSLPVGGTMTLIAWGRTILRRIWPLLMPRAPAASLWPLSTEFRPERTISDR